ncbi:MAG: hypothetical protein AVDCRST_MAG09-189, partial [uncultured Sphingomonas sp.]
ETVIIIGATVETRSAARRADRSRIRRTAEHAGAGFVLGRLQSRCRAAHRGADRGHDRAAGCLPGHRPLVHVRQVGHSVLAQRRARRTI